MTRMARRRSSAGVLFQRSARGQRGTNRHLFSECECADWTWYLDRVTIPGGAIDTPFISLKQALEWLIANLLTPYGFTLDPAQATGPAGPWKFEWERKYVSEILRDLTNASGGWIWRVNPLKQLRMIPPTIVTPTAPFSITDTNAKAHELRWMETSESYATRIILRCGGEGTKEYSEAWLLTSADITRGYVETTAPSTALGPISATLNAGPVTIGASGTQLIWTWETHRITAGSVTPTAGQLLSVTYTAKYPFEVIKDSGLTPAIEMVVDQPDLVHPTTARDVADGLLAQHLASPRTFDVVTFAAGLRPGQVLAIDSAHSASSSLTAMITEVRITLLTNQTWRYQATAVTGIYQGSSLDYFRGLGGVSTGSAIVITGPPTTGGGVTALARVAYTLSTGLEFVQSVPPAWVAASVMRVTLNPDTRPDATVIIVCRLRALLAGVSVTARLRNVTDSTTVGTSATITATAWTDANFSATLTAGTKVYQLELLPGVANRDIGAVAYLE